MGPKLKKLYRRIGIGSILLVLTNSAHAGATFVNPLEASNIETILGRIAQWILGLAAVIALISLVIGGVRMIMGGFGDEQEAKKAKQIIFWSIAGLAVVILSWTIIAYVVFLLGA